MRKIRIAITGATSLLGRNLLFEILKKNFDNLAEVEIFVLGRAKDSLQYPQRIEKIILDEGLDYIGAAAQDIQKFLAVIKPISYDLLADNLNISKNDLDLLGKKRIDYFFHIAAVTDFRDSPEVRSHLNRANVDGTRKILDLVGKLEAREIIYVSSAYCCGSASGHVKANYVNIDEKFRNPYERSKLEGEIIFRDFAERKGIKYRVFRPSTICGRLIENPIGRTYKFDVFYGWAAFFLRYKLKKLGSFVNLYASAVEVPINICINPDAGLNIVPADYAAKILYGTCLYDDPQQDYHLVGQEETPHHLYFTWLLDSLNISGYRFTRKRSEFGSSIEKFYYKTVGKIFTPYITNKSIYFDKSNLESIEKKMKIKCPPMNRENFSKLIKYAKEYYFGIRDFSKGVSK